MTAKYSKLDLDKWPRRATYDFFRDFDDPFFNIAANVDVSALNRYCREHGLSISLSALYYVMVAANEIREFRIRLLGDELVEFDRIHATQTILNDDETFSFAYFEMQPDLAAFNSSGRASVAKYKKIKSFDVEADRVDLIYFSVIPWVSFTSFKHATRLDRTQTVPRIVFGKIFEDDGAKKIPLSVEANHTIMDGLHVGKLFNRFQELVGGL